MKMNLYYLDYLPEQALSVCGLGVLQSYHCMQEKRRLLFVVSWMLK